MNGVPILGYHSIDDSGSFGSITLSHFERQMYCLWRKGYKSICLREYLDNIAMGKQTPPRSFVLTFDDGYRNNYEIAFPILKELRFTATIFVVTDFIGKSNSWVKDKEMPELPLLSWNQIVEMRKHGIDVQPHSQSHPFLTELTDDRIKSEVLKSKKELEGRLGTEIELFCYPHGKYNDKIVKILKDSGFKGAVTAEFGWKQDALNLFRIKRIGSRLFRKHPELFRICLNRTGCGLISTVLKLKKKGLL